MRRWGEPDKKPDIVGLEATVSSVAKDMRMRGLLGAAGSSCAVREAENVRVSARRFEATR